MQSLPHLETQKTRAQRALNSVLCPLGPGHYVMLWGKGINRSEAGVCSTGKELAAQMWKRSPKPLHGWKYTIGCAVSSSPAGPKASKKKKNHGSLSPTGSFWFCENRISLCSSGWPLTQLGIPNYPQTHGNPSVSVSQMPAVRIWSTVPGLLVFNGYLLPGSVFISFLAI